MVISIPYVKFISFMMHTTLLKCRCRLMTCNSSREQIESDELFIIITKKHDVIYLSFELQFFSPLLSFLVKF